jgi:hypothetical protein
MTSTACPCNMKLLFIYSAGLSSIPQPKPFACFGAAHASFWLRAGGAAARLSGCLPFWLLCWRCHIVMQFPWLRDEHIPFIFCGENNKPSALAVLSCSNVFLSCFFRTCLQLSVVLPHHLHLRDVDCLKHWHTSNHTVLQDTGYILHCRIFAVHIEVHWATRNFAEIIKNRGLWRVLNTSFCFRFLECGKLYTYFVLLLNHLYILCIVLNIIFIV